MPGGQLPGHALLAAGAALVLLLMSPSVAPAQPQSDAAPGPAPRPALISQALESGAAVSAQAWAFTQSLSSDGNEVLLRYDPREPGEAWTLLSPSPETASKEVIRLFEGVRDAKRGSELLGYENLSTVLGNDVTLVREEAEAMVYRFQPTAPPKGQPRGRAAGFLEKLHGELTVRQTGAGAEGTRPWIRTVRLFSPEPFKPNFSARIASFEQTATYDLRDGLPLLTESRTAVSGSALFRDFEESVTVRIIEAEPLAPPARNDSVQIP
ncbi:MAG: hypothetical protein ACFB6R_08920 [Alphaproteobacteria bacterium]